MASGFIESATLKIKDESSAQIKKINKELQAIAKTAKSLKSTKIDFKVDDKNISKTTSELKKLAAEAAKLKSTNVNVTARQTGLAAVARELSARLIILTRT
jgi:hypothetical protein